jgi:hypothetical protein
LFSHVTQHIPPFLSSSQPRRTTLLNYHEPLTTPKKLDLSEKNEIGAPTLPVHNPGTESES